jgi:hypothetical protein
MERVAFDPPSTDGPIQLWLEGSDDDLLATGFAAGAGESVFASETSARGDLLIALKGYCRLLTLDGEAVLYDSLNMNTIQLSPALGQLLHRAGAGRSVQELLGEFESDAKKERSFLCALLLLAGLKTISFTASPSTSASEP